jgi:hypothetical protein
MCHRRARLRGPPSCVCPRIHRRSRSHLRCVSCDGPDLEDDDASTDGPCHPSVHGGPPMPRPSAHRGSLLSMLDQPSHVSALTSPRPSRTCLTARRPEPRPVRAGSYVTACSHVNHRRARMRWICSPTPSWSVYRPAPPALRPAHTRWFHRRATATATETLIRGGLE